MASIGVAIPYLVFAGLAMALLWGSILAVRGRRWWAPVVMVVGSSTQILGAVLMGAGVVWMMMQMPTATGGSSASSASSVASAVGPMVIMTGISALLLCLGFVLFAAGFVGFCARSGAAEHRAQELESLVSQLQEHRKA